MAAQRSSRMVPYEEARRRRPVDEAAVARMRDEILSESRANRLADLRKEAKLSQVELAARIGIDQPRVSRLERGDLTRAEVGSLAAFAEGLGGTLELVIHLNGRAYPLPVSGPSPAP